MIYLKNKKGFTLVELLLALGIMGIVLSAIFTFFIFNYKSFVRGENQVEAQYQSQIAMNELIENIMDAEKIAVADLENKVDGKYPVKILVFKISDDDEDMDTYIKFEYKNQKLYKTNKVKINSTDSIESRYKEDIFTTNQYAVGIRNFQIELQEAEDYKESKGIKVFITININNEEIHLKNQVYFRNWKLAN